MKINKIINYLRNIKTSRMLLAMMHNGYLLEIGWLKSNREKQSVDAEGNPIPWTTYSFIHFISTYLIKEHTLFEYGSGNSTLYYASRAKQVVSIEHNEEWYNKVKGSIPGNVELIYKELDNNYVKAISEFKTLFDIIIVDGRRRNECIQYSVDYLNKNGILVLDDSEREKYQSGINFLTNNGFKRIDFWGISPGYFNDKCTSIFFKNLSIWFDKEQ